MPHISRREWISVLGLGLLVAVVTTIPYALGWARSNEYLTYIGSPFAAVDYNSHLAKMEQGARGQWSYRLLYTSEEHDGAHVQMFYIFLGHVARRTGLTIVFVYQLARILCVLGMVAATYIFMASLLSAPTLRWLAQYLACLGGGLGWLQLFIGPADPGGISPIDFWLIDAFPFFSALMFPHFAAAIALMALSIACYVALLHKPTGSRVTVAALCSCALSAVHPYSSGTVILISGIYGLLRVVNRQTHFPGMLLALMALALPAVPALGYDAWLFLTQPVFRAWSQQNVTLSPPPVHYLVSYAPYLILGVVGAHRVARRGGTAKLAITWVVVVAALLYAPTNLQRRFLEGLLLPLSALTAVGTVFVLRKVVSARRWRRFGLTALLAFILPSNLALITGATASAWVRSPTVFITSDVMAGIDWLGENAGQDEVVLSSFDVGNLIPARTGRRVYLGHWMETIDYERKKGQVAQFYDAGTSDQSRRALLKAAGIHWVFHGPDERELGGADFGVTPFLVAVYRNDSVMIYRVDDTLL